MFLSHSYKFASQHALFVSWWMNCEHLLPHWFCCCWSCIQNGIPWRLDLSHQDEKPTGNKVSNALIECVCLRFDFLGFCRYSFDRHGTILSQGGHWKGSANDYWATLSHITTRCCCTEEDVKDLLFTSWTPEMAKLFSLLEKQSSHFSEQLCMLQKFTLLKTPMPFIMRHQLYTAQRKPGQNILSFFSYLSQLAVGAVEDQDSLNKEDLKDLLIGDILQLNVSHRCWQYVTQDGPKNILGMIDLIQKYESNQSFPRYPYDHNEKKQHKDQSQKNQKECVRCKSVEHSTAKCHLYQGKIPSGTCRNCNQGLHFTSKCKG